MATTDLSRIESEEKMTAVLEKVRNDVRLHLAEHADKAVRALTELVTMADSEAVRLQAALKLLALVGVSEVKETKTTVTNVDMTIDADMEALAERLEKNQKKAAAIEVTATEVV